MFSVFWVLEEKLATYTLLFGCCLPSPSLFYLLIVLVTSINFSFGIEWDMGGLLQRKRRYSSSSSVVLLPLFWAFFLAIFLERSVDIVSGLEYSKDKQASSLTLERIQKHLDKINKPAVMTIEVFYDILNEKEFQALCIEQTSLSMLKVITAHWLKWIIFLRESHLNEFLQW